MNRLWVTGALLFCLRFGAQADSQVALANGCNIAVDAIYTQDMSSSVKKALPQIKAIIPEFMDELLDNHPTSRMAFSGYIDYPFPDVGFRAYRPNDYCLRVNQALTSDRTKIELALDSALPGSGRDIKEAQLVALQQLARGDYFSTQVKRGGYDVLKLIILQTNSRFHVAGDLAKELALHPIFWSRPQDKLLFGDVDEMPVFTVKPNDGDAVMQCGEDGSEEFEDYPTIDQVGSALRDARVALILLPSRDLEDFYEDFAAQLRKDYGVVAVSSPIEYTATDLFEGLDAAFSTVIQEVCTVRPQCSSVATIDLNLVQDITASYQNDLPNIKALFPTLMMEISGAFVQPQFALSVFDDKPLSPFGSAQSGDNCFSLRQPMTTMLSDMVTSLNALNIHSGADWKEDQLNAMIAATLSATGWRWGDTATVGIPVPLARVVVLATDSGYHQAGDGFSAGLVTANTGSGSGVACTSEDYPHVVQVIAIYKALKIYPVFLVTNDVFDIYNDLAEQFISNGLAAVAVRINNNSSNIVQSVKDAVNILCRRN